MSRKPSALPVAPADPVNPKLDLLLGGIAAVAGGAALAQSWNRWLDPLIDTGRDLYIPGALLHGAKLYRDIRYFYPPLTPYLLAAVTAVTGDSLRAFAAIGIAIAVATAALLYAIVRAAAGPLAAGAAATLFAASCVAGPATWGANYVFPYAHAATIGMLLFLAEALFLFLHVFRGRNGALLVPAIVCAIAASWTKVEFALFAAVIFALTILVYRLRLVWLAAYGASAAISVGVVSLLFRDCDWKGNILPPAMLDNARLAGFYRMVGGYDRWPELSSRSLVGAAIIALVTGLLWYASRETGHGRVAAVVAAAAVASGLALSDLFFAAWSVLQIALIPVAVRRRESPLPLLLACSLAASSRVYFHLVPRWYGFVFVVPLLATMAYVLFEWLPEEGVYSRGVARVWLLAVAVAAGHWLLASNEAWEKKTHPIVTPRGTLFDSNGARAAILSREMGALRARGVSSLLVIPEGLTLNYLYRLPLPVAYHTFTPAETADPRAESAILAELARVRPPWIAFVQRDLREFGYEGFGRDYDLRLSAWIAVNYTPRSISRGEGFGFVLLQRR